MFLVGLCIGFSGCGCFFFVVVEVVGENDEEKSVIDEVDLFMKIVEFLLGVLIRYEFWRVLFLYFLIRLCIFECN